jgi:hypothetical protein
MDGGDSTEGNRRAFTTTKYDTCGYCCSKALLRSYVGHRYAFLHFRRFLT